MLCMHLIPTLDFLHHLLPDKAAPARDKGDGGRRRVVARVQRLHVLEAGQREGDDAVLGAAAQHDVLIAVADGAHGFADGVVGRRAGRHRAIVFALEAEAHGDVGRGHVGDELRDGQGRDTARALGQQFFDLDLGDVQAADARAIDDARAQRIERAWGQAGLVDRLLGGCDGKVAVLVHALGLALLDILGHVEVLDLGGQLNLIVGDVHMGNGADAAFAFFERLPEGGHIVANRRDRAHACDDDSFHHVLKSSYSYPRPARDAGLLLAQHLLAQFVVHQFAGGRVRQLAHQRVRARPLVGGQHGRLDAVLLDLLHGQAVVRGDDISRDDLAAQLVRNADNGALRDLGVLVEDGLDLGRVDVLACRDDHVVLAAADGDELVFVPGRHVARVQPALIKLLGGHFRVVVVAERRLGRRADDDLARCPAVARHGLVGLGMAAVLVHGNHAHVVVGAGTSGRTRHFRQVVRPQEGVPEGFGRAVAVEDVGGQKLHVFFAGRLVKGRAHGDDAAQGGQVGRGALLRAGEHGQDGRHADEESDLIALGIFEAGARVEIAQDDHLAAHVERRAGAARVDAAAVEPGRHVHGAVGRRQREVHDDVMGGQHLVDVVDGDALGAVGRARSVQAGGLVVDMGLEVDGGIGLRLAVNIGVKRDGRAVRLVGPGHDDAGGLVRRQFQGTARELAELGVIDKGLGTAVLDDQGDLARALAVVDRAGDGADLVGSQIAEDELG